jgi:hypothetical protein
VVHERSSSATWDIEPDRLPLDDTVGSPWLLVPPAVRAAFDRLAAAGPPLARSSLGRPLLGVKSGCNDAYAVTVAGSPGDLARVTDGTRIDDLPREHVRPVLRGEAVTRWRVEQSNACIVWPHAHDGAPLPALPESLARWLRPWRRRLAARADARGRARWWSLFRTEAAADDVARVVWPDVARAPRAAILDAGEPLVPLNSCYALRCAHPDDAHAFAALLNSPLAAAWLAVLAEPARGGYHRYLAWTVARLPLPDEWPRARALLAPIARRARCGQPPAPHELLAATLRAYRLRPASVQALLDWAHA